MSRAELLDYLNTTEEQAAGMSDDELRDAANEKSQDYAQDNMGEGSEFGAYDYEKLAMGLPNGFEDEKEVLKHGYDLMKSIAGSKKADYLFHYDEDFPSDFVSAYFWLQDNPQEGLNDSSDDADTEPDHDFDQEYNDESIGDDHVNRDEKLKRMGAKPLSTLDKLKMMPRQMKAMARGDSENDLVNYNKMKAKRNESIQGDNMSTLREGEIQQAQSIVTAKTMVDRVGRWIEELSGMENDTLLQLGDQIRDEQGQEAAKGFISSVAPAIQQALENLKATRESLASGVRTLTGEEQSAAMLGAEPEAEMGADEFGGAAEPDAMNAEVPTDDEVPADDFAAAEPAAGGVGDAGRAKRESIDRSNSLLKVLAG
jgi:hypothetical protein